VEVASRAVVVLSRVAFLVVVLSLALFRLLVLPLEELRLALLSLVVVVVVLLPLMRTAHSSGPRRLATRTQLNLLLPLLLALKLLLPRHLRTASRC